MTDVKGKSASVLELFRDGRGVRTFSLWLAFFCCLLMVYALGSWLPKLMANAGYSLGSSLSFLLALNFGGMAGAILGGWLGDRYNLSKVVVVFRSEEHTSELQSLMRISYAVFCLKKKRSIHNVSNCTLQEKK